MHPEIHGALLGAGVVFAGIAIESRVRGRQDRRRQLQGSVSVLSSTLRAFTLAVQDKGHNDWPPEWGEKATAVTRAIEDVRRDAGYPQCL